MTFTICLGWESDSMSRTSIKERNKAIRKAWEREQQLVREGTGTRDWTKEQQQDILDPDKGKAYDDRGRAFEGQHMKSASEYPEYQGDLDNIQFLTREEHLEAHKGSWQNPTNWYYDPITKRFTDFGDGDIIPCKVIELSDPISRLPRTTLTEDKKDSGTSKVVLEKVDQKTSDVENNSNNTQRVNKNIKPGGIKGHIAKVADAFGGFAYRHPTLVKVGKWIGIGTAITVGVAASNSSSSGGSGVKKSGDSDDDAYDDCTESEDACEERDYPEERNSPREHNVSGYDRQQNGKTVHVKPYTRGGRKDEDD